MKSERLKISSNTDLEESVEASVFDFLYHDAPRVASFVSQFTEHGNLTQVVQKATTRASKTDTGTISAGAGIPLALKADASILAGATEGHEREGQQVYDPLWTNALILLEYLSAANLIERDIHKAGMGQFVLVTGDLWIVDLGILKTILDVKEVQQHFGQQFSPKPPAGPRQAKQQQPQQAAATLGMALVRALPHLVQARLVGHGVDTWSTLSPAGMTIPPADLLMKHGMGVEGEWSMLGILDARAARSVAKTAPDMGAYVGGLASMLPHIQPMMGRPVGSFGVTPLLIFREVAKAT